MRSEKDQMTAGKEKSVVEIQFRDVPREQENTPGNPKQKEEKKEVFTKVGGRAGCAAPRCLRAVGNRHGGGAEGGGRVSAPRTAAGARPLPQLPQSVRLLASHLVSISRLL